MLIQLLIVILIIGLLYAGPTFDNILITLAFYGGIIGGLAVAFWYAGRLSGGIADALLGGSGGRTDPTFGRAEQYERERKFQAAIELYQKAISKDKRNPTPRLKLADLHLRLRNYDLALQQMKETLQVCRRMPMSERCALMNRMADIHLQHRKDSAAAAQILSQIISEFPDTKYSAYARERIAGLQ
jgi:tetratricopeptide (TPR) repeat protein